MANITKKRLDEIILLLDRASGCYYDAVQLLCEAKLINEDFEGSNTKVTGTTEEKEFKRNAINEITNKIDRCDITALDSAKNNLMEWSERFYGSNILDKPHD